MSIRVLLMVLVVALVAVPGCSPKEEQVGDGTKSPGQTPPTVCTVNYPLAYFAERIGGTAVTVKFPAPADGDPAFWVPDQATIFTYQQADLILLNGATYAKWIDKISLPDSKLINTSAVLKDRYLALDATVTHSHGPEGEHAHGDVAFTTWLDPTMAVVQARAITEAFLRKWPQHTATFEANYTALEKDLLEVDKQVESLIKRSPDKPLLFSHPVYQYFTQRYGIKGKSVHWEPDAAPTPTMWNELDALVKEFPATWMIWEGEPMPATVEALGKKGIRSLVFDPCGNRPETGDYLSVMRNNVKNLEKAFTEDVN